MRGLRAAGHDVTVLHIMDPAERDFRSTGEALFIDPETELDVPATVADVRAAYRTHGRSKSIERVARVPRRPRRSATRSILDRPPFGVPLRRAFAARQRCRELPRSTVSAARRAPSGVPLLLHLLRRHIATRVEFPAARYLARAEREHSRTLRMRNLLLMLLRVLARARARPRCRDGRSLPWPRRRACADGAWRSSSTTR